MKWYFFKKKKTINFNKFDLEFIYSKKKKIEKVSIFLQKKSQSLKKYSKSCLQLSENIEKDKIQTYLKLISEKLSLKWMKLWIIEKYSTKSLFKTLLTKSLT